MMINCPKCNLLQPKDQYCAQCGINMETWKPPERPLWKKITGNWMFQLSVLFIIVVLIVLRDNFRAPSITTNDLSPPPVENLRARPQEISQSSQPLSVASENKNQAAQPEKPQPQNNRPTTKTQKTNEFAPPTQTNRASFEVKMISRALLERIMGDAEKVEETIFSLKKEAFNRRVQEAPNLVRSFGLKNTDFEVGSLSQFFIGEEDRLNEFAIGFFLQMTVIEKRENGQVNLGLRKWNQLKLSEELSQQAVFEVVADKGQIILILEDSITDMNFTNEERALFQASNRLSLLNTPSLQSGLSEVVLVLDVNSL